MLIPILEKQIFKFEKTFYPIFPEDKERGCEGRQTNICVFLHLDRVQHTFYLDLNEAFNTANHIIEFSSINFTGNRAINALTVKELYEWLAEIVEYAEKTFNP